MLDSEPSRPQATEDVADVVGNAGHIVAFPEVLALSPADGPTSPRCPEPWNSLAGTDRSCDEPAVNTCGVCGKQICAMHTRDSVPEPDVQLCPTCSAEERDRGIAEVLRKSGLVATVKTNGSKKGWWSRLLNWMRTPWQ